MCTKLLTVVTYNKPYNAYSVSLKFLWYRAVYIVWYIIMWYIKFAWFINSNMQWSFGNKIYISIHKVPTLQTDCQLTYGTACICQQSPSFLESRCQHFLRICDRRVPVHPLATPTMKRSLHINLHL